MACILSNRFYLPLLYLCSPVQVSWSASPFWIYFVRAVSFVKLPFFFLKHTEFIKVVDVQTVKFGLVGMDCNEV